MNASILGSLLRLVYSLKYQQEKVPSNLQEFQRGLPHVAEKSVATLCRKTKQNKQKKASGHALSVLDWFETQSLKQSGCRLEINGLQSCGWAGAPGGSQWGGGRADLGTAALCSEHGYWVSSQSAEPCRRVCAMRALCHENSWRISVCPVPEGAGMCHRLEPWLLTLCSGRQAYTNPSRIKWLQLTLCCGKSFSLLRFFFSQLYFKPCNVASRDEKKKKRFNIWVLVPAWPPANSGQGRRQGQTSK